MFRAALALIAVFVFSCCAPLSRNLDGPYQHSGGLSGVYTIRVINYDYDVKNVWVYCDGTQSMVMRGFSAGEDRTKRLRDSLCDSISFKTEGHGGRMLYESPPIAVPQGILEITLTEHPGQTHWRTDTARHTGGA